MSEQQRRTAPESKPAAEGGTEALEKAQEQGFRGTAVDEAPNEDYTVQGVAKRKGKGDQRDEEKPE